MPKIIIVEGTIGSGKSTFIEELSKKLPNTLTIYENIFEWENVNIDGEMYNFLEDFYNGNISKDMFQYFININRLNYIMKIRKEFDKYEYIILERSLHSTYYAFCKTIENFDAFSKQSLHIIRQTLLLSESYLDKFTHPDYIVYLNISSKNAYDRILSRNRKSEKLIAYDYLEKLTDNYNEWAKQKFDPIKPKNTPISVDSSLELDKYVKEVLNIIT
uniref:Deoxynucleoside kinase domain-containing protein n=1 Tax=viral metagenome TaxID=1070528 RepID=A0A6C0JBF6_9ZZZZ